MLEISSLAKRYGDVVALSDMTFDVRPGELFGFVGANGAGKTTTMRIVMGVLAADSGAVRWNGRPVDLATRRRIGYMPEERGLYPRMKVGAQLQYFARLHGLSRSEASAAARRWMSRLGIAQRADDDVLTLSLGNQQRVQLATALVHDPDVLVLDEPFSGLDPVAVEVMGAVLRERSVVKGSPVLFSSHQLDLVERLCDRIGIVRDGTIVACGTVDELRGRAPALVAIDAPGLNDDWITRMPGVSVNGRDASRWILRLDDHVDDHLVLMTALASGPVREFARVQPTLTDLFREATAGAAA
ncbi:ABC-2 type transport system ATP-binding protein [Nocardia tenerifensis]|uniref:ABC-2 type transport system ATP-binding protein n=2 Tax=Nocardia tenerifensis TaxID=228006 RepID=A0A318KTN4_9NOCA|nr:ABC-2 type transport system ATP-binding protein [Nocardia tenerifensis]